jgi:hypothetical protein
MKKDLETGEVDVPAGFGFGHVDINLEVGATCLMRGQYLPDPEMRRNIRTESAHVAVSGLLQFGETKHGYRKRVTRDGIFIDSLYDLPRLITQFTHKSSTLSPRRVPIIKAGLHTLSSSNIDHPTWPARSRASQQPLSLPPHWYSGC